MGENNNENENIKNTIKDSLLSDNPFDMLGNVNRHHKLFVNTPNSQPEMNLASDEKFLSILKKSKVGDNSKMKRKHKIGIFSKIRIISQIELFISTQKFFKFPFDLNIKNDGSNCFKTIYNTYLSALSSVYSNFRRFEDSFKVYINGDIIWFENELRATRGVERLLRQADVDYCERGEYLIIEKNSLSMLYDMLINLEIVKNLAIPLILSKYEFENGIVFHTKIEKGPTIKSTSKTEHFYTVFGPLYTIDVIKEDEDVEVIYDE